MLLAKYLLHDWERELKKLLVECFVRPAYDNNFNQKVNQIWFVKL